ncbi:hypothetical protein [Streptomyces sulphureus]|uniref:hypothetical protein n=1 Tax=Streptomyces sulphureus TaxID=47758 RepID=UPI00036F7EF0|nr:hypothetical protein [Streptomyces sulphureus]
MQRQWIEGGECWRCDRAGVPVLWLGPVQTDAGTAPFYACDPCVRRIEARVQEELAAQDTAPAH